ncbi:MAG TPA: hypothetical protein VIJ25_06840, partial [Methylococcales bacterium]
MTQQFLPETPEKTQQHVEGRETSPDSTLSFQGGLHPIAQLQRTLGNRNVAKLIQAKRLTPEGKIIGLQRKLTIGASDDQYEQEAADHGTRGASEPLPHKETIIKGVGEVHRPTFEGIIAHRDTAAADASAAMD